MSDRTDNGPSLRAEPVTVVVLSGRPAGEIAHGLGGPLCYVAASAFAAPSWNETPVDARRLTDRMLADAALAGFVLASARLPMAP